MGGDEDVDLHARTAGVERRSQNSEYGSWSLTDGLFCTSEALSIPQFKKEGGMLRPNYRGIERLVGKDGEYGGLIVTLREG
jgi:hypothetical protein